MRTFLFRGRAAHVAVQVNGNHWLRLNPIAARWSWYIHVFISISPLRASSNADTHPSSAVLHAYLIRIFYPASVSHCVIPSLPLLQPTPFPLPLFILSGKFVFESFLLTDSLDLLSVWRPHQTTELTLRNNSEWHCWFLFSFSTNTNSFASLSPRATCSRWKKLSWFSFLIPSAMLKPSLWVFFFFATLK